MKIKIISEVVIKIIDPIDDIVLKSFIIKYGVENSNQLWFGGHDKDFAKLAFATYLLQLLDVTDENYDEIFNNLDEWVK